MAICQYFLQGYCRFGQNCRNEHVFASKYSYKAPQTQNSSSSNHFNTNTNNFGNNSASSIFRTAVQNTSPFQNRSSLFAPTPAPIPSVFDRLGSQQGFAQQTQAKSIFASANQNAFNQVPMNVFPSQNQVAAKSLFAEASKNIFGQSQGFNPAPAPSNVFNKAVNQNISWEQFPQQTQSFGSSNVFQISHGPPSNPFGVTYQQTNIEDDSVYSEINVLSEADIEAFECEHFKLGFIPELPPPRTACF